MNNDMSVTKIGIDPGSSSGALAFGTSREDAPVLMRIPGDAGVLWGLMNDRVSSAVRKGEGERRRVEFIVEDVGASLPGNSARSSNTFAQHVGGLRMLMAILEDMYGVSVTWLRPVAWMDGVLGPDRPKGRDPETKRIRKHMVLTKVNNRWPGIKCPLYAADAAALVLWSLLRDENGLFMKKRGGTKCIGQ